MELFPLGSSSIPQGPLIPGTGNFNSLTITNEQVHTVLTQNLTTQSAINLQNPLPNVTGPINITTQGGIGIGGVLTATTLVSTVIDATTITVGTTMVSGTVISNLARATGLSTPIIASEAVNKAYVDSSVTSPGGSDTQVQYNNNGQLAGFGSWNGTTLTVSGTVTNGTVVISNTAMTGVTSITNVQDPVNPTDIATKEYADENLGGVGGSNTQIQYNEDGPFGANSGLTWNYNTNVLTVANTIHIAGQLTSTLPTGTPPFSTIPNTVASALSVSIAGTADLATQANNANIISSLPLGGGEFITVHTSSGYVNLFYGSNFGCDSTGTIIGCGSMLVNVTTASNFTGSIFKTLQGGFVSAENLSLTNTPYQGGNYTFNTASVATATSQNTSIAGSTIATTVGSGMIFTSAVAGFGQIGTLFGTGYSAATIPMSNIYPYTGPQGLEVTSIGQGSTSMVSLDGSTVALGGQFDNTSTGAVWIFVKTGTNLVGPVYSQQGTKLVATSVVGISPQFGSSVSISNNGNVLAVGSNNDNSGIGATWIFTRTNQSWFETRKIVGGSGFGTGNVGLASVSISGDGTTIAFAAINTASNNAAWIYSISGSQIQGPIVGSGASSQSLGLGSGIVTLSNDGQTLALGVSTDNNNTGAVWIFTRSAGNNAWNQLGSKLVPSGRGGRSLSLSSTGLVLAAGAPGSGGGVGAAYIFVRSGLTGLFNQTQILVGTAYIGFPSQGTSVAISNDTTALVVGGYTDSGSYQPLELDGGFWIWTNVATATSPVWSAYVYTAWSGAKFYGATTFTQGAMQGRSVSWDTNNILVEGGGVGPPLFPGAWVFNVFNQQQYVEIDFNATTTTVTGNATVQGSNLTLNNILTSSQPYYIYNTSVGTVNQTVNNGSATTLTTYWGANGSGGTVITQVSQGVLTVSQTGYYLIFATVGFSSNSTGIREISIQDQTSSSVYGTQTSNPSSSSVTSLTTQTYVKLTSGDNIAVVTNCSYTGSLTTYSGFNNGFQFGIVKLS